VIVKSETEQLAELLVELYGNVVVIEVARMIATALDHEDLDAMKIWLAIGGAIIALDGVGVGAATRH